MSEPLTGRARDHEQMWGDDLLSGDFEVRPGGDYILLICPCGCMSMMNLPIYTSGDAKPAQSAWMWNGNREKPTLQPSIRDLSTCKFHGFLTDGVWTFCGDSGR